jgi:hypothetical protein
VLRLCRANGPPTCFYGSGHDERGTKRAGPLGLLAVLVLPACTWSSTCSVNKITTESLPDATVGQVYSFTLTHNCSGREAGSWQLQDGALPPGLALSWDGRLLGTPTATGSFGFSVLLSLTSRGSGATIHPSGSDSRTYARPFDRDQARRVAEQGNEADER